MRQFVSIFVVTSVACLLGLSLKKADFLKTLYQEFMTPQKWRRVEIVDEKSMFEKLISDYIWEYLEVLFVGLTASIFTFTIGWSAANSMRRGSADSGDEDIPEECLEENCDGFGRVEEVEEIITEIDLEQCGYRLSTRKTSTIELKLSESETMKKTCRSDCNGNGSCRENEEYTITSVNRPTIEEENGKPATCKSEIKAETCDKLITTEIFDKSGRYYRPPRVVDYVNLFKESTNPHNRDSHEMLSDECKFNNPKVKIPQRPHKKVTKVDDLGGCKSRNEKSDHFGGQVQKAEVEMNFNDSESTKMDTLEVLRNEHGDSYLNSFRCTNTEKSLEERTINKSDVNRNINKVGDTNREMDSNNRENFSTKTTGGRVEVEQFSKSDVSASTVTVAVDGTGPGRDSAGSAHWSDSSHRIDSSGRTPHYKNLNKEIKPKTTKLNKKDNRTVRAPTAPHKYIDELSRDVLSTQQSNSERPSTTASGDTLRATGSQRRKKNQKYHAQNSSNKTDSKNC